MSGPLGGDFFWLTPYKSKKLQLNNIQHWNIPTLDGIVSLAVWLINLSTIYSTITSNAIYLFTRQIKLLSDGKHTPPLEGGRGDDRISGWNLPHKDYSDGSTEWWNFHNHIFNHFWLIYLQLGDDTIVPTNDVKVLWVTLSSDLTMDKHVSNVCSAGFYRLRQLRRVRRSLDTESAATLVHAFVTSRIDYCNVLLAWAPKATTDKLQRLLNAAARLLSGMKKFDRGLSKLMHVDLH